MRRYCAFTGAIPAAIFSSGVIAPERASRGALLLTWRRALASHGHKKVL
jgi:hypothetical protein